MINSQTPVPLRALGGPSPKLCVPAGVVSTDTRGFDLLGLISGNVHISSGCTVLLAIYGTNATAESKPVGCQRCGIHWWGNSRAGNRTMLTCCLSRTRRYSTIERHRAGQKIEHNLHPPPRASLSRPTTAGQLFNHHAFTVRLILLAGSLHALLVSGLLRSFEEKGLMHQEVRPRAKPRPVHPSRTGSIARGYENAKHKAKVELMVGGYEWFAGMNRDLLKRVVDELDNGAGPFPEDVRWQTLRWDRT